MLALYCHDLVQKTESEEIKEVGFISAKDCFGFWWGKISYREPWQILQSSTLLLSSKVKIETKMIVLAISLEWEFFQKHFHVLLSGAINDN